MGLLDPNIKLVKKTLFDSSKPSSSHKVIISRNSHANRPGSNSNYSGVVNLGKANHSGNIKENLSVETKGEDISFERPPSPRDIAAKFEQISKNQEISGRYLPGAYQSNFNRNDGGCKKSTPGPFKVGVLRPQNISKSTKMDGKPSDKSKKSTSPEIINPMDELTNLANKVRGNTDFDDYGPFNFRVTYTMLKIVNKPYHKVHF